MGPRQRLGRRGEAAGGGDRRLAEVAGRPHLLTARPRHRHVARRALVQQELGGLHHGLGVEALAQAPAEEHVGERGQGHALVMRHVGAHHRHPGPLGPPRAREVQRLVEAVGALPAQARELDEVSRRRGRVDHGGERGRVGRDHEVLAQPALEPEPWHAEARVLVRQVQVAHVVRRLGDAPGDAVGRPVGDVALDHEPARLLEQAALGGPHDQRGHEVLEHRPRPGDEGGAELERRHGAAETEPVRGGHLAAGDAEEAGQARLGGQQVVPPLVEGAITRRETRWRRAGGCRRRGRRSPWPRPGSARTRPASPRAATPPRRRAPTRSRASTAFATRPRSSRGVPPASPPAAMRPPSSRAAAAASPGASSSAGRGPSRRAAAGSVAARSAGRAATTSCRRLRPRREGVEVAPMAGDGRLHGVHPRGDLDAAALLEPGDELAQGGGAGGEVPEARGPGRRRVRLGRERGAQLRDGLVEAPRRRVGLAPRRPDRLREDEERVVDPRPHPPVDEGRRVRAPGSRRRARSGGRRGCRCPRSRRSAARAAGGSACRTSCRSGRGSARAPPCSPGCRSAGRRDRGCRSSRGRGPTPPRADRAPCWSATCDGPPPDAGPPGSCPAAARGPRRPRRSRRSASSAARRARSTTSSSAARPAVGRGARRQAQPPGHRRRQEPEGDERERDRPRRACRARRRGCPRSRRSPPRPHMRA